MKLTDLQKIDQNIIKFLSEHRGIDRAVKGKILAQALDIDLEAGAFSSIGMILTALLSSIVLPILMIFLY